MEKLHCYRSKLTTLDVSKNTQLKDLSCSENELASLDVSKNTQLQELYCYNNQLTSLNISGCTQLRELHCYNNRLPEVVMNKIYNDLPVVGQGEGRINVDWYTAGDYYIAENKGWNVRFW
ncbi:leucine-rich repeat domain-containing protein [uncultured Rikenella sp.]|uniref:leucine-rich repeat domain-containing protein n=1 Tax=uncultured Rikenella sp. TaxID=368003 RepID=UPI00260E9DB2|nr:leucine-rich repeat domain-containing protein [uncultured Rikenella sp.]